MSGGVMGRSWTRGEEGGVEWREGGVWGGWWGGRVRGGRGGRVGGGDVRRGGVLGGVETRKTMLSYEVEGGGFRFIEYQRLRGGEIGDTSNEPGMLCLM